MGIPSVPKFNVPNLCGASEEMNDMLKKKDELMKKLEDKLEASASELKAEMDVGLKDLQNKLKKLAPEMPTSIDTNLQSELKSLATINTGSLGGQQLYDAKKLSLSKSFDKALTDAGSSFEKVLKKMEDNLAAGGGGCNCGVPNMMIGADGKVKEKPENPVTPVKESEKEEKSTVVIPKKAMNSAMTLGFGMLKKTAPVMAETLGKITQSLAANDFKVTPETLEIARAADAKMKATIGEFHPQIKKVEAEFAQYNAFNNVDSEKALENPDKKDANTVPTGAGGQAYDTTNGEKLIQKLEKEFKAKNNELSKALLNTSKMIKGFQTEYPDNISEVKDGVEYVWMPVGSMPKAISGATKPISPDIINFLKSNLRKNQQEQKDIAYRYEQDFEMFRPVIPARVSLVRDLRDKWENETKGVMDAAIKGLNDRYAMLKKAYSKPCPPPKTPRGPKTSVGTSDQAKIDLLNAHSNIESFSVHQSGMKLITYHAKYNRTGKLASNGEMGRWVTYGPDYKSLAAMFGNGIRRKPQLP